MSRTIKIYHSELQSKEDVLKFTKLFGKDAYFDALKKLSVKRYGDGKLDELAEQLKNADDEDYKGIRRLIEIEQEKLVPMKKDAAIEMEVPQHATDQHKRDTFISYLGADRFLKAYGLEGYETASKQTLKKVNPGAKIYEDTKHQVQKKSDVVKENASGSTADQQTE